MTAGTCQGHVGDAKWPREQWKSKSARRIGQSRVLTFLQQSRPNRSTGMGATMLGKLPPKQDSRTLKFKTYTKAAQPPPIAAGYSAAVKKQRWPLFANN